MICYCSWCKRWSVLANDEKLLAECNLKLKEREEIKDLITDLLLSEHSGFDIFPVVVTPCQNRQFSNSKRQKRKRR